MDWATVVSGALQAVATAGVGYVTWRTRKTQKQLQHNTRKLDTLTDIELNRRIHEAVVEVLAQGEGDALRSYYHSLMRNSRMDT